MVQVGGSATINGILYQLLGTLDHACTSRMDAAKVKDGDIVSLRLTVEPQGGGGDVVVSFDGNRRVEQWKAKTGGGTWSLAKIIEEVLPDLYRALPTELEGDSSVYCFMTEGRIGSWQAAFELLQNLPPWPTSGNFTEMLDNREGRHKLGSGIVSDRQLFNRIVDRISQGVAAGRLARPLLEERVRHLLARFKIAPPISLDRLVVQINTIIRHHVDFIEDVNAKRRELCGVLLEFAAAGDVTITAEQLLTSAGIPLHTFRSWDRLRTRLRDRLAGHLAAAKYDAKLDVRSHNVGEALVTAISGEGGQGKSWQLARFASEAVESQGLVVWVSGARNNKDAAELAAREIWNFGLERDAPLELERIAQRRFLANPNAPLPWATICVDDVNSKEEAEYLSALNWGKWGIRLVFTTNVDVGVLVEKERWGENVPLADFGTQELHKYLKLRGKEWRGIAHDVEQLIRRPILASIYASTVKSVNWQPENEYEVVESFWNAVADPIDYAALRKLSGGLKEDDARYPWPAEHALEYNISHDSIRRLIDAGWLRDEGNGCLAVWHQRLLAWAFAEALSAQFRHGEISLATLGQIIAACSDNTIPIATRGVSLGYAPMDVLWRTFGEESTMAGSWELWRLIVALEGTATYSRHSGELYEHLIGSLGRRAVSHVVARVQQSEESETNFVPRFAASALIKIGTAHRQIVSTTARDAVRSDKEALLELGLRLTAAFPDEAELEKLWQIHQARVNSDATVQRYHDQQLSRRAFHAAVAHNLSWLDSALQQNRQNPLAVTELTYTLANTPEQSAIEIWKRKKEMLLGAVPAEKRRCLVHCILRFRDSSELDRLEKWIASEEDFIGSTALQALAYFDQSRACRSVSRVPLKQLSLSTGAIGRCLFVGNQQSACDAVRQQLVAVQNDVWSLVALTADHGDRLDRAVVERVIDLLDGALLDAQQSGYEGANHSLWRPLNLVEGLHGRTVLEVLRNRRESEFERRLADFACGRADNASGWVDHEFKLAQSLLRRIAGSGFSRLINVLLSASDMHSRMTGCEEAVIKPDERTFKLLRDAAMSDAIWNSGSSGFPVVQQRAVDALAALGRNRDLVDAVVKWGTQISPHVSEMRSGQPLAFPRLMYQPVD